MASSDQRCTQDRRVEIHTINMDSRVAEPIARRSAYSRRMVNPDDRGSVLDAGYLAVADLPADLDGLLSLHGVGPKAVRLLQQARAD
jgi:endonuclease III